MKKLLLLFVLFSFSIPGLVSAQNKEERMKLNREEFMKKMRDFYTDQAKLTDEEADKFFPLYFELQDKKNQINRDIFKLLKEGRVDTDSEDVYKNILEGVNKKNLESVQLESTYLELFKDIIPYKKIYKIHEAEMKFRQQLVRQMRHHDGPKKTSLEMDERPEMPQPSTIQ